MNTKELTTREQGALLACDMLEEIAESPLCETNYTCDNQYGAALHDNFVMRYLLKVQAEGNEYALAGFCAVLTDWLCSEPTAAPLDLYREIIREGRLLA